MGMHAVSSVTRVTDIEAVSSVTPVTPVTQRVNGGTDMNETETARHTLARSHAREEALLAGLLAGKSVTDAAADAGVSRRTAYRMRDRDSFQAKYREAKNELLGGAIAALHNHALNLIETLAAIASDQKARGSDRVLAGRHGLDLLLRGVETLDFEERLRRLEQVAAGEGGT